MFIIGELINGMYAGIGKAIQNKDKAAIQECALKQVACGADALDINCGPASRKPLEDMPWLVETVQEVTDKTLCLDASKPLVIEAGLKAAKNKAMINSTTADSDKLNTLIPLALKYGSSLIGLTISAKGIPQNKDQRLELAAEIIAACSEKGFPIENLYLDPILMPVNVAQAQMKDILESIHEFKLMADPSPKTIVGLSNVSQGTSSRSLINRTFLAMSIAYGLDSAILDPLDGQLMDALITAELIMSKNIYCASYLDAYRKK
ncbi:MAG: dihydropteroate synthase [Candidatus Omnitrophota bacterium]